MHELKNHVKSTDEVVVEVDPDVPTQVSVECESEWVHSRREQRVQALVGPIISSKPQWVSVRTSELEGS
jgi:hypothetical protein